MGGQTKQVRALEVRPARFTPDGADPFYGREPASILVGETPQRTDVGRLAVSDDDQSRFPGQRSARECCQQEIETFLDVDAREKEQDPLLRFPTELSAGVLVVRAGITGEPERKRFNALLW